MILVSEEQIKNNPEYAFPPVSDKFIEGYQENYNWTAKYIRFRKLHSHLTDMEVEKKLIELSQPYGKTANGFRGALLGLAVGDALGTTNEFKKPGSFQPIDDLVGGGPFNLLRGQWTDDTSMAYALGQSLIYRDGFDANDQMNKYLAWWKYGAYSCTGECFDIGNTVRAALERYELTGEPEAGSKDPMSAGNGSLMRLAPIALFYFGDIKKSLHYAGESSKTTHGANEAVTACQYFAALINGAIAGVPKAELLNNYEPYSGAWSDFPLAKNLKPIVAAEYLHKSVGDISPTSYVIDTLEAALWCFANSENFKEGALMAANLGGDADTVASVYGQISGAYYGECNIPAEWIQSISYQHIFFMQAHKMLVRNQII